MGPDIAQGSLFEDEPRGDDLGRLGGFGILRPEDLPELTAGVRRVFDLADDPRETQSLSSDFGEVAALLEAAASNHGRSYPTTVGGVPPSVRRGLEALGYLERSAP